MARIGNASNKKDCAQYRAENRRGENKAKKQARHLKRLAYFARRAER